MRIIRIEHCVECPYSKPVLGWTDMNNVSLVCDIKYPDRVVLARVPIKGLKATTNEEYVAWIKEETKEMPIPTSCPLAEV